MTYKIIRHYFNDTLWPNEVIETGLTLEEAQAHCHDPETSSSTCSGYEAMQLTLERGKWFDGYDEE